MTVATSQAYDPPGPRAGNGLYWSSTWIPDLGAVRAVDLFAGTGALGFELASRGAQRVTLIESNRRLIDQLTLTKRKLVADQVDIITGDALVIAAQWPDASFEIIFIDPPFDAALVAPAVAAAARLVARNGLIYVESGAPVRRTTTGAAPPAPCAGRPRRARALSLLRPLISANRRPAPFAGDHDGDRGVSGNV